MVVSEMMLNSHFQSLISLNSKIIANGSGLRIRNKKVIKADLLHFRASVIKKSSLPGQGYQGGNDDGNRHRGSSMFRVQGVQELTGVMRESAYSEIF
jgi:hypothetical protein